MSDQSARIVGSGFALIAVVAIVATWVIFGPATGPTKQWPLATNMLATLATCLVLVLVQYSQKRGMRALQTKDDELIRSSDARNHLIGVDRLEKNETAPLVGG
jgi:low affinity Fe/Cu permease